MSKVFGLWEACSVRLTPYALDKDYEPSEEMMDKMMPIMRKWFANFATISEEV